MMQAGSISVSDKLFDMLVIYLCGLPAMCRHPVIIGSLRSRNLSVRTPE